MTISEKEGKMLESVGGSGGIKGKVSVNVNYFTQYYQAVI